MKEKWIAKTSKWKAALDVGLNVGLKGGENVLYLGASYGTTVRQIADKTKGIIFAVEKAERVCGELIKNIKPKKNIAVIFEDAHNIEKIKKRLSKTKIDVLFQDIPSLDQIGILERASEIVEKDCKILFSLKMKSISKKPVKEVLKDAQKRLKVKFKILQEASLERWHKGHWFFVLEKA